MGVRPWSVRLDESYDPSIRHIAPVHVDGPQPFRLLAVWAFNRGDNFDEAGRGPLARGFERYQEFCRGGPLVVAGDFNNNVCWDGAAAPANRHSAIVATLEQWGLFSVYHHDRGAGQGHEPEPTLYWRDRRADGFRYHIDYVFAPEAWKQDLRRVEVGDFASWVAGGLSDHVPLIADFAFHYEATAPPRIGTGRTP